MYCIEVCNKECKTKEVIGPFNDDEFDHIYQLLTLNKISVLDGRAGFGFSSDAKLMDYSNWCYDGYTTSARFPTVEEFLPLITPLSASECGGDVKVEIFQPLGITSIRFVWKE